MLTTLAIANYRSLRQLVLPLDRLTVVTGPNGSGKSSVYKSLRLLADIASGGVVASLVREGGLDSALWAGPEDISARMKRGEVAVQGARRKGPVRMKLGFASDDDGFGYAMALGSAAPSSVPKLFERDPEIKHEAVWAGPVARPASLLVQRDGPHLQVRDEHGRSWQRVDRPVPGWASMMTEHADPHSAPEMLSVREQLRRWRFYDHFRSDADAPARVPRLGSFTPVLAADGGDLAAAWASIEAIGDEQALAQAVDDAFPGATVSVDLLAGERFALQMQQAGLLRPLHMAELSDGTLRYLLWVAALLTPRPPPLLVLNEPETSLHPDLLPALGRLIARAATQTQVIVVSHANRLLAALEAAAPPAGYLPLQLDKQLGETVVAKLQPEDVPRWSWLD